MRLWLWQLCFLRLCYSLLPLFFFFRSFFFFVVGASTAAVDAAAILGASSLLKMTFYVVKADWVAFGQPATRS